ncbi:MULTISPECIES: VanZ family protein [unclassified Paenibacillus]|uniref:VanZ family protein n=1 Tax=unclassified Paenibacillus TaxID=185978 RepID=UPI002F3F24FE
MFKRSLLPSRLLNIAILCVALIYALVMIKLLFIRSQYFGSGYSYNLVPFDTIKHFILNRHRMNANIWIENLLGNIILFIPIGVFLPLLNRSFYRFWPLLIACVLLLFGVELLQMLLRVGSFDVDDIILNTIGALLGFAGLRLALFTYTKILQ